MLLDLSKILGTLGLVTSLLKPIPIVGDIVPGLVDTVGGVLNSTLGPLLAPDGAIGGLVSDKGPLGGLLGDGGPLGAITGDHGLLSGLLFANNTDAFFNGTKPANGTQIVYCGTDPKSGNSTFIVVGPNQNASDYSNCTQAFIGGDSGNNATLALLSGNVLNTFSAPPTNQTPAAGSCTVEPYSPATPLTLDPFPPFNAAEALVYRYRQQQSVNLGSWFVQEQWMNPSLFKCANGTAQSELDIAMGYGGVEGARMVLEKHWDEWITEMDFKYLASIGINTVRLPIGYWSLGPKYCVDTDFADVASVYTNSWPRIVRAINWAEKYGLGILIDLHGAPGSQNGQTHSGVSTGQVNMFYSATSIQQTIDVLTFLTQQLVGVNNVVGIELLNEPADDPMLEAFYTKTLSVLRATSPQAEAFPFYIHDAFNLNKFVDYVANRTDFVVQDHHSYFVFDPTSNSMTAQALITTVDDAVDLRLTNASDHARRNLVVDEWSCALSNLALKDSTDPEGQRRAFCTSQMQTYANATAGWSFWSLKTEHCASDPNWCFLGRVGTSLPTTFHSYPNTTTFALPGDSFSKPNNTAEHFAFGNAPATLQGLSTPQAATLLLAALVGPAGTNNYVTVNELLSTSAFDTVGSAPPAAPVKVPAKVPTGHAQPLANPLGSVLAVDDVALPPVIPVTRQGVATPPANFPPSSSTGSLPTSNVTDLVWAGIPGPHVAPLLSGFRRRLSSSQLRITPLPQPHLAPHRLRAPHMRRESQQSTPVNTPVQFSSEQAAIAQGYADGFKAAKSFAVFGGSRLGFTGQFVEDALRSSAVIVGTAERGFYRTWFMNGLADGEVGVLGTLGGLV